MSFQKLQDKMKEMQPDAQVETKEEVRITLRFSFADEKQKELYEKIQRIMKRLDTRQAPGVCMELLEEAVDAFITQVLDAKSE